MTRGARWLMLAALVLCAGGAAAEDKRKEPVTVLKTQEGLRFQLPADWPVEKRGGIVAPIPVEEYLSKRFSAMEARMQEVERMQSSLDLRMRVLEEESKKQKGLKSVEGAGQ